MNELDDLSDQGQDKSVTQSVTPRTSSPTAPDEARPPGAATATPPVEPDQQGTVTFAGAPEAAARDDRQTAPERAQSGAAGSLPTVPGYEVLRLLGRGGMGVVYQARHLTLDRAVALKMILAGEHADEGERVRFRREAQAAARLQHPNIVQVYEVGQTGGYPFLSLEYLGGGSLDKRLAGTPQPARAAAHLVQQLAQAMAYAHEHGVIHRDLKPANVLLASGEGEPAWVPKISDFGLAKLQKAEAAQTQSGAVVGTPSYMAPEQAAGKVHEVGPAVDTYALGAILYECLTGRPPFKAETALDTLMQVMATEPVPPSRLQPRVPRDLETICLKCLQKDPRKRYAGCAALAADLQRFQSGEPIQARPISTPERFWRWCRRNPRVAALCGAVAFLLVVAAVVPSVLAWHLQRANVLAEQEKQNALDAQGKAVAAKNRAEEAENVAVSQTDLAFDALGDLVLKVQLELDEAPGGRHLRKELLEDTMQKLHRLYASPATSDRLFRRHASAHMQLGEILWGLNRRDEAEQEYKLAGAYAERAFAASPTSDKAKANVAANNNRMGDTELFYHKRVEPARKLYEAAVPLWEGLATKMVAFPDGDPALPELERINLVDAEEAVADTYDRMGIMSLRFDFDYAKAEEWFTRSLAIRQRHVERYPSRAHRVAIGASYIYLAEMALQHNELAKALSLHEELVKQRQATFAERSWSLKARRELADAQGKFGDDLMLARQDDEAHKMYVASRDLFVQVRAAEPDDPIYRGLVAHAHYRCGTSFLRVGDPPSARHEFEEGLKLRQAVYDEVKDARQRLNMQPQLMFALVRCGKLAEAAEMAASVRQNLSAMPIHLAEAGSCYGLCMAAVGAGKPPEQLTDEEKRLRAQYLSLALACFEEARQKKYDDVLFLGGDADMEPLQEVPEFKQWLESFRRSLQSPAGPRQP
jgi:eukaryotic-like serine/threonine-protein kinase